MSATTAEIFLHYVCPSIGAIMASVMFAAPVGDLKKALNRGSLQELNPLPWVFMTGNCLGWVAYGYYIRDPYVLAGNMPGLVVSIWLNIGAIKIQYSQQITDRNANKPPLSSSTASPQQEEEKWDGDVANEEDAEGDELDLSSVPDTDNDTKYALILVSHERAFFRMVIAWVLVLVWVGWVWPPPHPEQVIGIVVNVNLVFFYGAPLQTIWQVMRTGSSESIHRPSMFMNWTNTSFWLLYAVAIRNVVIALPNALGLLLGIAQGIVCLFYPRRNIITTSLHDDMEPIPLEEPLTEDDANAPKDGQQEEEDDDITADADLAKKGVEIRQRREGGAAAGKQQADWNVL